MGTGAKGFCALSLVWMASVTASRAAEPTENPDTNRVTFALEGAFNWGRVDGFMQVPSGGQPGTSTPQRPTFDELGIHDTTFWDAKLDVRWRQLDFFAGAQIVRFNNSGTLASPLVSHGVSFAAGDAFDTQDRFDWYDLGAGWRFEAIENRLTLMPKVEGALFDFGYNLTSGAIVASRTYSKPCIRLGLEADYRLSRVVSVQLDGGASIPISNTPQIATVVGTVRFDLLPESRAVKPTLFIGGGGEWINYEDNQPLPNHVQATLGPFLTVGFALAF